MPNAQPITNASEGSHVPTISKKFNTLAGLAMPPKMILYPKISPMA
jgi:hypothetical protein